MVLVNSDVRMKYDEVVSKKYKNDYINALESFESIAEKIIRPLFTEYLERLGKPKRSIDQSWRKRKGDLYEYAVIQALKNIIEQDEKLKNKLQVLGKWEIKQSIKDKIAIRNWSKIYPDVDILILDTRENKVITIISCKTSLRERLTETAYWKYELMKHENTKNVKVIFVTTDKDEELHKDVNRYIAMHVIDCTFITDPKKYLKLMKCYKKMYSSKDKFNIIKEKIRPFREIIIYLSNIVKWHEESIR